MKEDELQKRIVDAFQIVAVLLVFVTILYGIAASAVTNALGTRKPDGEDDIKRYRGMLWKVVYASVLPVAVLSAMCSYLLVPLVRQVIGGSRFDPTGFDLFRTALILVECCLVAALLWSGYAVVRLVIRIRE